MTARTMSAVWSTPSVSAIATSPLGDLSAAVERHDPVNVMLVQFTATPCVEWSSRSKFCSFTELMIHDG